MKLRTVVGGVVGAIGGTAVVNRLLQRQADEFEPFLSGTHRTYRWRGFDIGVTEAGDPDDPDLVLLHGINAAASGHEFHAVFEQLTEQYHVLAPDLPGYGQSDRPPLLYSASLLTTFAEDLLSDEADNPTVVASSLSGSYAAVAANETDIDELVLICPTDSSMGDRNVIRRSLLRSPVLGEALFNCIVSKPSIRHFHADHGYYSMDNLTDDVVDYEWQSGHQPGARFAPASFVSGFLDPDAELGETLAGLDVPITLVWGEDADITPLADGRELAEQSDAKLVSFGDSLLLPHVEHPEQFVELLEDD
jgi:pimeloyl-ACP methyl ester carboxylesterase